MSILSGMNPPGTSKRLVSTYHTTRCHNPQGQSLNLHRGGNHKYDKVSR